MIDATFALRLFAKYRKAQLDSFDVEAVQETVLYKLLRYARNTQFGRDHGFSSIRSVKEYQERVPLRSYEDFWEQYWKDTFPRVENKSWPGLIKYYCWTSGTTSGKRKFVPYTEEMAKAYGKAGTDLLVHHVLNRPKSKVLGGKSFMMGGTTLLKSSRCGQGHSFFLQNI